MSTKERNLLISWYRLYAYRNPDTNVAKICYTEANKLEKTGTRKPLTSKK